MTTPEAVEPPSHQKAWHCRSYGGPEILALVPQAVPRPGPRQLLARVEATTVDSGDVRIRSQRLPRGFGLLGRLVFGWRRPRQPVLGSVLAGTVAGVGASVQTWRPGDRIVATLGMAGGGHAQWALLKASQAIVRRPGRLSAAEAASLVFGGLTAQVYLDGATVKAGERLLVIGATGAVGSAPLQQARARGLVVTALASAPNLLLARDLGAAEALDYREHPPGSLGGGRFDVVADTCASTSFAQSLSLLRPGGRFLAIAADLPAMLAWPRHGRRSISGTGRESTEALQRLMAQAARGELVPLIDSVWPYDQLPAAHARAGSGHKRGSVVVQVAPA
jgi:NADPH:quinone reductase-like Zn-dependent oxidoreductase